MSDVVDRLKAGEGDHVVMVDNLFTELRERVGR